MSVLIAVETIAFHAFAMHYEVKVRAFVSVLSFIGA